MKILKRKSDEILVAEFDDICRKAKVIGFNEHVIEIKGVFTFHKAGYRNVLDKLIDSPSKNIEIEESVFNDMVNTLKTFSTEPDIIVSESKTKPAQTLIINLAALKADLMISFQDSETISLNNFVFTSSIVNFHGEALVQSQKVFYLGFDNLSKIQNYIFGNEIK